MNVSPTCQIPVLDNLYDVYFRDIQHGLFIDVGAFDGIGFSNTSCLAEAGWHGIMIEPFPEFAKQCEERYKDFDNVLVQQCAVSNYDGMTKLYTKPDAVQMPTISVDFATDFRYADKYIEVPCKTLNTICKEADIKLIDLISIDVEGGEAQVLEGFSILTYPVRCAIIEVHENHYDHRLSKNVKFINDYFRNNGYDLVWKDTLNNIFVKRSLFNEKSIKHSDSFVNR